MTDELRAVRVEVGETDSGLTLIGERALLKLRMRGDVANWVKQRLERQLQELYSHSDARRHISSAKPS